MLPSAPLKTMAVAGLRVIFSQTLFSFFFWLCRNYYYKTVQVLCSALRRLLLTLSDFILVEGPAKDAEKENCTVHNAQSMLIEQQGPC